MNILHGTWIPNGLEGEGSRFVIWGEAQSVDGLYLLPPGELDQALRQAVTVPDELPLVIEQVKLFLPTYKGSMLPSTRVLVDADDPNIQFEQWEAHCISLYPSIGCSSALLSCLLQWGNEEALNKLGIIVGQSLLYWSQAAAMIMELLVSQHYIPHVKRSVMNESSGKGITSYGGKWDALLDDPGIFPRKNVLLGHMPGICNAVYPHDYADEQIETLRLSSRDYRTDHFIQTVLDLFVRESLSKEDVKQLMESINPRYVAPLKPTEHWLYSLFSAHSVGGTPALEWIADEAQSWRSSIIAEQSQSSFRTCFRLEEPVYSKVPVRSKDPVDGDPDTGEQARKSEAEDSPWMLRIFLQAESDPSLLVPAELVWSEQEAQLHHLHYRFEQPQERLLKDLGQAAHLFPPLRDCLKSAKPIVCELDTIEAHRFLKDGAQRLEKHGFGVYIPSWWQQTESQIALTMKLKPQRVDEAATKTQGYAPSQLGFDAILDFEWQVALGDESLSKQQFEQMVALKLPLLQVRGKWIDFSSVNMNALLQLLEQRSSGQITMADALKLALNTTATAEERNLDDISAYPVPVSAVTAEGAIGNILKQLHNDEVVTLLDQPSSLQGSLRPYQQAGFSWLISMKRLSLGACLADDMGLGKTIQWIAYMLYLKQEGMLEGPVLLICPTSVLGNWQRELERFSPILTIWLHYGPTRLSGEQLWRQIAQSDIVLTSYTTGQRDEDDLYEIQWDVVTLDEAQNIKNTLAKQSRAIRRLQANHRIALTGTPVENRLSELWSIMDFLNSGYLGSQDDFLNRFSLPIEKHQDQEKTTQLHRIVRPFIMRRVKSDARIIQDLPDKQEMKVYCPLTQEQVTLYEACVHDAFRRMERARGMERRGIILATLTHLKQICNHPTHYLADQRLELKRSGKMIRLVEMVDEIIKLGERVLIFTQYAKMADLLQSSLENTFKQEVLLIHGRTAKKKRDELIERFQVQPDAPSMFVLSLKTGGFGVNLTRANHVIHYDRWWNPAVENQATDRVYRIGQVKNVQVHKFICAGTMEERIDQMLENKQALASSIIGKGEQWMTEMSTAELKSIFLLRRDLLVEEEREVAGE